MWTIGLAKTGNEIGLNEAEINALDPDILARRLDSAKERMWHSGAHYVVDGIWDVPPILDDINARLARGDRP
jgi:phosphonoacetaldehyde hydrolase